jgi:hypothetical protein
MAAAPPPIQPAAQADQAGAAPAPLPKGSATAAAGLTGQGPTPPAPEPEGGPATAPAAAPSGANGSGPGPAAEPGPAAASQEPPPDPDDWSQELAGLELQLRRLGWGREQEAVFLERAFGHPSRSRLTTYADLMAYLRALEALVAGADPASAAVPLRRRDLLHLGDELLNSLGWSAERGRHFLEEQLGQTSRQRLSDAELMRFNMLLEEELIQLDPA